MPEHKTRNTFHSNLRSKQSLLMKFVRFYHITKEKIFTKNFNKNCDVKTSSRSFCGYKELSTTSIGK